MNAVTGRVSIDGDIVSAQKCDRCGEARRGSANIGLGHGKGMLSVCHPNNIADYPDCYRIMTVYGGDEAAWAAACRPIPGEARS